MLESGWQLFHVAKKENFSGESILGAFQLGKTPGNDGIPIEFYKIFWPLIGKFLIASFNEAFDNKQMSPSQKQALITLIEKKRKR